MGTQTYADLPPEDADRLQQGYEDDGATVERVAGPAGITLKVTYPDEGTSPAPPPAAVSEKAAAVIAACKAAFPAHQNDCSGFLRQVSAHFNITLTGLANEIVDQIRGGNWQRLANGVAAKAAAEGGKFVVAGLKGSEQARPDPHGHVVVVVTGPLAHGAYPSGYWGRLGGGGRENATLNWAWNSQDRDNVTYAARDI